jgi:hypothetical protein
MQANRRFPPKGDSQMDKKSNTEYNSMGRVLRVTLLIGYVGYILLSVFSVYAFNHYTFADRYGASDDATRLVNIASAVLLITTLVSFVIVTKLVVAVLTGTSAEANHRLSRRALFAIAAVSTALIVGIYGIAAWHYNLPLAK